MFFYHFLFWLSKLSTGLCQDRLADKSLSFSQNGPVFQQILKNQILYTLAYIQSYRHYSNLNVAFLRLLLFLSLEQLINNYKIRTVLIKWFFHFFYDLLNCFSWTTFIPFHEPNIFKISCSFPFLWNSVT
jgi:hypothetical protein